MTKSSILSFFSCAALTLALVGHAGATTITIGGTSVNGEGVMSSHAGATTTTFDGLSTLPSGFSKSGTNPSNPLVSGSDTNLYLAPAGDSSTYLTTGTGVITDVLKTPATYFGFYWGSLDAYNYFSITDSKGNTLNTNGAAIAAAFGLTDDGKSSSSYFVNFSAAPGATFTAAAFSSSTNSFEFDNVATATPEPGTIVMLSGGLLIVAGVMRRRKA